MASVFDQQKIGYALQKFADFINGSGSGSVTPGWADAESEVIIGSLQAFEEKLRARDTLGLEIGFHVGTALYAICELRAYFAGDNSDIANLKAARVYLDFLAAKIDELREMEQALEV